MTKSQFIDQVSEFLAEYCAPGVPTEHAARALEGLTRAVPGICNNEDPWERITVWDNVRRPDGSRTMAGLDGRTGHPELTFDYAGGMEVEGGCSFSLVIHGDEWSGFSIQIA